MATKKQDSPIAFHGSELMFGNAAHLLEAIAVAREPNHAGTRAACAFGGTVLRALSVELALKFLAYLRSGQAPSGHDLRDLYDGLDQETKHIVTAIDVRTRAGSPHPPVVDILTANRDASVSIRYLSLKSGSKTLPDWLALGRAHNVLIEAGSDPDFRALCPTRVKHV